MQISALGCVVEIQSIKGTAVSRHLAYCCSSEACGASRGYSPSYGGMSAAARGEAERRILRWRVAVSLTVARRLAAGCNDAVFEP